MVHERNLGGKERVLPNKSLRAIDRIHEPQVLGVFLRSAGFLTIETVLRKCVEDKATNGLLAFDVGLRDRRHVFLGSDREIAGIVRTADVRRLRCRREGDLVVHVAHGIARYRGMKLLEKNGQAEEHLTLEFHGRALLYVPSSKIALVQKYVGGAKARPTLARLGVLICFG